jgi:hypothetical protein
MDALGSMPLLNTDNILNSWEIAVDLSNAAEADSLGENTGFTLSAQKGLIMSVAVLEGMLFESAFASMVYQASDEWDRNPYVLPLTDSDGDIQRMQPYGTPRTTDALQDYQDPITGEWKQGYQTRNDVDALLHSLGENRPVFAHVMSLIMNDSTYLRQNMPVKTQEVKAEELSNDDAYQILMSITDGAGGEIPTTDGAEAVVRGVHLGALTLDSPALQGFFITNEQRFELQERFLEEMTIKYLELGMSKSDATAAAEKSFYGQGFGEPEATGLADIIWDKRIPAFQNQEYMQLNTTYVMGPNGRPIATGLQRSVMSSMGINLVDTYHTGATSNIGVDQLLNSVDEMRGMNLGMRGLVKVDESWIVPTDEEIGKSITDSLQKISDKLDDIIDANGDDGFSYGSGWRNYGRGSGWGSSRGYGGYGGSSYVQSWGGDDQRMNTPRRIRAPYSDDLYSINTSSPIIRRATIRRERFSSQRGRLNQWQ